MVIAGTPDSAIVTVVTVVTVMVVVMVVMVGMVMVGMVMVVTVALLHNKQTYGVGSIYCGSSSARDLQSINNYYKKIIT